MKPLSKKQLITLNIAAKQAYDYQLRMGGVDWETLDQWRHDQVKQCVGREGLRQCTNDHYRALVIHFATAAGKIVSYDKQLLAGKPTRRHAEEDTYQNRQKIGALARSGIDHACPAPALLDQFDDPLVTAPALAFGAEGQFGPCETVHKLGRVGEM